MADTPVIELRGVGKTYYNADVATPVLFDMSFEVGRGEFVAIVGGSGSGKTTLLNLMGLLDRPTTGEILVDGRDAGSLDELGRASVRRERLGFIFQFHYLLPEFTVIENALMPCRMKGRSFQEQQEPRMRALLEKVGLGDKLDSRPAQLSGGQQQRVAVVRSLANDPALVLADEPTGNLDTRSGRVVFDLMRSLSRESGTTFVMVTHDDNFALEADRLIRIRDGRIE
ncbi:MAG: ABC transporter ATP-binding protein [Chromatiales bacterium]|jgi:lipoprotein-releasing system ATP-binding protein|nr:ABC transporter ATP-binding protein [Chromatiales bacterium]